MKKARPGEPVTQSGLFLSGGRMEQVGRDVNAADRVAVRLLLYAECSDARKLVPHAHSSMWLYSTGNVSLIFIKV